MASKADIREVSKGRERRKRFDRRDWKTIAEWIKDEFDRRKRARFDLEKQWADVDRQLRMEPDISFKKLPNGRPDVRRQWMSEVETPFQSQTLEVLTADARRMMFPDSGPWFAAHAELSDAYLDRVELSALISGDENEVPSLINQDNADKLVAGFLNHIHRQYDFYGNYDLINAEAFKYGMGIGRARIITKPIFIETARGLISERRPIPVLVPRSIKNTYLDDNQHALMNEGVFVGPSVIYRTYINLEDLILQASRGSNDPDDPNGGWMPANLKGLEGDRHGNVELLEYEGDLVVPRKTVSSLYIPGAIATVAVSKEGVSAVRFRFRKTQYSSYLLHPYHAEDLDTPYATAPLMKGRPLQIAATSALNRFLDAAALKNAPPIGYEKDDAVFAMEGGPRIAPYEVMETVGEIKIYDFADPVAMLNGFSMLARLYADMTGVNEPRLGAQTVSHTTAFAKEAEISRGTVRTVDYVRSIGQGPLTRWLHMEYDLARDLIPKKGEPVYIDAYKAFVNLTRDALPDRVVFEWFGSGGPAENRQKSADRLAAAQIALQIDTLNQQLGGEPVLDRAKMIEEILREGGWVDTDAIKRTENISARPSGQSDVGGAAGISPDSAAAVATLQALAPENAG